jgi:type II secretory pathway predicted ATPase ExeA
MYEEYWGFKEKPFQNTPDPRFFYKSSEHEEALMKMMYVVEEGLGAGVLTGVFGCGKTVIGQALREKLPGDKHKMAFITNPQLEYVEFLRAIVRNLKTVELPTKKTELSADFLLETLGDILENNDRDGRETIVIIDEAHIIKDERIFEELRLLLNFQRSNKFLLTLLLFGQPELRERVEDNKQLEQRIAIKCHLEAFGKQDTHNYIVHRLNIAGGTDSLFDESAFKVIHSRSGGIPRRINRICDLSLLVGMDKNVKHINEKIVEEGLQILGGK